MNTLIIIPAYNEGQNLSRVIDSLKNDCKNADFIIINDGSTDNTAELAEKMKWPIINLPVNLGLAGAFQTGMRYGTLKKYDAILQFDGDGQHDAKCAAEMIETMSNEGGDIIIGSRFVNEKKPATMRMIGSRMLSFAIKITTGKKLTDPTSGMRLFSRNISEVLANNINYGPEPDTIAFLMRNGASVKEMQVIMHDRIAGTSYLTAAKSIKYMINMFFSILLIQFIRKGDKI